MQHIFLSLCLLCMAYTANSQCAGITLVSCPADWSAWCDNTPNDSLLWNAPPLSYDPQLHINDLGEGPLLLSVAVRDTCSSAPLNIAYTLFLDLDGDLWPTETVVQSTHLPPPGKVLKNNLLNPGYTGGDTLVFDKRPVPDSLKYGFTLIKEYIGDTVLARVGWTHSTELPQLPLGRHRIEWRLEQGGVVTECSYWFTLKDCAPPVVHCSTTPLTIDVTSPWGYASLMWSELALDATDNITPDTSLVLSSRRLDQPGTEFPADGAGNGFHWVNFSCEDAYTFTGIVSVELWAKDAAGNTSYCITDVNVTNSNGECEFSFNPFKFVSIIKTPGGVPIPEVETWGTFTSVFGFQFGCWGLTNHEGIAICDGIPSQVNIMVTNERNDNPLNGVTTYDLVLMSKHILGTAPLFSPYKMIAADINRSGSITTFDIVSLRKLILGIDSVFKQNTSWRFIPYSLEFSDPNNPFESDISDTSFYYIGFYDLYREFIGIKTGDVNESYTPDFNSSTPRQTPVSFRMSQETVLTQLFTPAGYTDCNALQIALAYDPQQIEIESVTSDVLSDFNTEHWAVPRPGELRVSWSAAAAVATASDVPVLQIHWKPKSAATAPDGVFRLMPPERFASEWYDAQGNATPIQLESSPGAPILSDLVWPAQPNPTSAGFQIPVWLDADAQVLLELYDALGQQTYFTNINAASGYNELSVPAKAMPLSGAYCWRLHKEGRILSSGKILKR